MKEMRRRHQYLEHRRKKRLGNLALDLGGELDDSGQRRTAVVLYYRYATEGRTDRFRSSETHRYPPPWS